MAAFVFFVNPAPVKADRMANTYTANATLQRSWGPGKDWTFNLWRHTIA